MAEAQVTETTTTVKIALVPIALAEAPTLANLLELYAHDFSEYVPLELRQNGRFELVVGNEWWEADDHYPFFVHVEDKLAGFALVRRGSRVTDAADVMDVAEFFVVRGARRRGIGSEVVRELFRVFPGRWEARVRPGNAQALAFWPRAFAACSRQAPQSAKFEKAGVSWQVFRALAKPADSEQA
jgi:predicted acetyltransferase